MALTNPTLESLLARVDNKFALINGVAKRAQQLKEGALPMVDIASGNPVSMALEEIAAGRVRLETGRDSRSWSISSSEVPS